MCNEDQREPTQSNTIELIITIYGRQYHVVNALPSVVRASSGPMSVRAGIEPAVRRMMEQAIGSILEEAAMVLDDGMPRPRETWWQLEEALGKRDVES